MSDQSVRLKILTQLDCKNVKKRFERKRFIEISTETFTSKDFTQISSNFLMNAWCAPKLQRSDEICTLPIHKYSFLETRTQGQIE